MALSGHPPRFRCQEYRLDRIRPGHSSQVRSGYRPWVPHEASPIDSGVLRPGRHAVRTSRVLYRFRGARALARIEREHLPLVFSSSKTRAELELIQQELGLHHPFICENGAAVFVPRGYFDFTVAPAIDVAGYEVVEFGKPYTEVVASLHRAAHRLDMEVIGFSDMSVEDVANECDLSLLQARTRQAARGTANHSVSSTSGPAHSRGCSRRCAQQDLTARVAATTTTSERAIAISAVSFSAACIGERLARS